LDFSDVTSSSLYIGGIPEDYRSTLQWSIPLSNTSGGLDPRVDGDFHQLTVFDLTICNYNLFQSAPSLGIPFNNYGGVNAIVDTGASCLTLPAEYFDQVVSWLPVTCNSLQNDGLPMTPATCRSLGIFKYYFADNVVQNLPTLSFRLSPGGDWLYLDIATLIYAAKGEYSHGLCIRRGYSAAYGGGVISFGSLTLRSFIAVMNMETFQVAFANKITNKVSMIQCIEPVQCKGMQTHYSPLNICEDPPCSSYYFFTFNDQSETCELSTSFHVVAIFMIIVFILAEIGLNEIHKWLSKKTIQTIELS